MQAALLEVTCSKILEAKLEAVNLSLSASRKWPAALWNRSKESWKMQELMMRNCLLLFAPGRICMFATNQLNALPCTYMSMLESFSQHEPRLAKKIFAQLPPLVGVLFHSSAAAMKIAGE